jgi:hypothetical protein
MHSIASSSFPLIPAPNRRALKQHASPTTSFALGARLLLCPPHIPLNQPCKINKNKILSSSNGNLSKSTPLMGSTKRAKQ